MYRNGKGRGGELLRAGGLRGEEEGNDLLSLSTYRTTFPLFGQPRFALSLPPSFLSLTLPCPPCANHFSSAEERETERRRTEKGKDGAPKVMAEGMEEGSQESELLRRQIFSAPPLLQKVHFASLPSDWHG